MPAYSSGSTPEAQKTANSFQMIHRNFSGIAPVLSRFVDLAKASVADLHRAEDGGRGLPPGRRLPSGPALGPRHPRHARFHNHASVEAICRLVGKTFPNVGVGIMPLGIVIVGPGDLLKKSRDEWRLKSNLL